MGTNYYGVILPTKKRKEELCDLINNSTNFNEIINEIERTYCTLSETWDINEGFGRVHLGKRSGGWKFLWNPNVYKLRNGHTESEVIEPGHTRCFWVEEPPTYHHIYPLTKKGIKEFIDREDVLIYDEYGEQQDKDEFFNMALNWTTWTENGKEEEAWDSKSYQEWEESQGNHPYIMSPNSEQVKTLKEAGYNVEWPYSDFYSDGLRFSTSTNFG